MYIHTCILLAYMYNPLRVEPTSNGYGGEKRFAHYLEVNCFFGGSAVHNKNDDCSSFLVSRVKPLSSVNTYM